MSDMRIAMKDAIQKVLHDFSINDSDKGLVIHYSISAEVVGGDGEIWLKHLSSEDLPCWKEAGMLLSALDDVRAKMRGDTSNYGEEV